MCWRKVNAITVTLTVSTITGFIATEPSVQTDHETCMLLKQAWRVYQRGLERFTVDLLQPLLDTLVKDGTVPRFVQRLRIVELTLDHEAPYFSNMRRRSHCCKLMMKALC